jgi:transposase InsO family protein
MGPGHPSKGFFTDNGGEFLNDSLIDFASAMDISIKMTAANSPWMNGSCERSHATVDRIIEKILEDEPNMNLQRAVDLACFVKNSEINKTGYSPLQLFHGKSPSFPGYSDCTPASIELEGSNEYLRILRRLDNARITARKIDCDHRMKIALKSKINKSCEKSYSYGDPVYFKLSSSHKWRSGMILGQDGKILFVRYGNFIRRVPLDNIIPADEYIEASETEVDEEDVVHKERLQDDEFENVELISLKDREIEMLKKLEIEKDEKIQNLEIKLKELSAKNQTQTIKKSLPKHEKSFPTRYQRIKFQLAGKDEILEGKVVRKHKDSSVHKNIVGIKLIDGTDMDIDFSTDVEVWNDAREASEDLVDTCCLYSHSKEKDIMHDTFATILTKAQVRGRPEIDQVMQDEIKKFENFKAFKVVDDNGQFAIKTRWVYSEHTDETKGYKLKARLCMRGDKELDVDKIRSDSPTAHKDTLKLALSIAANEEFEVISGDIKSAFLQGRCLDCDVFVIPPAEANQSGKLWLMQKAAYGLVDGSWMFYLELKDKLERIGMKTVSGDPALFSYHQAGKLSGLVCVHVDDLLVLGNESFKQVLRNKLFSVLHFSKVEQDKFVYLGCEIEKIQNGDIELNQNEYIKIIEKLDVPEERNSCRVNESERKEIRRVVGALLWVSLMTRPDLSFEVNRLSSRITNATIRDLKDAKRLIEQAKMNPLTMKFTKLGPRFENENLY